MIRVEPRSHRMESLILIKYLNWSMVAALAQDINEKQEDAEAQSFAELNKMWISSLVGMSGSDFGLLCLMIFLHSTSRFRTW